ncbi:MAG TPA: PaaX family transcriptional regulator C-terminal domain-containing protein [Trebonia sp.]|jgi:phenylacetic acid degradation operon negative regulatory protein|nr:PaaX family transcriptional regulator C-terminal domain-containing protein [Trebonia sp.]
MAASARASAQAAAQPAAGPQVSRRHQAGAPSARGLLLTVLGEFVLPAGGAAWTSALLAAFARMGVAEKATRQALMRASQAGWLRSERDGRRARWELTPAARRMLTDGAERIYSFGQPGDWDQRWVVVSVRIPESDRRARHVVRTRLTWAGFGALAAGLWISPHAARAAEAERVLREAGAGDDANVFLATRHGLGDTRSMVATAWDLPAVEAQYAAFAAQFRDPGPPDVLTAQIELVHAWRRFPALDPALPAELLPAHWSGASAARLFAERRGRWAPGARREWQRLDAGA